MHGHKNIKLSCLMLSSHLYLGLPCDLLVRGFHLNIFLTVLVSDILCTWPNQLSLWDLIQLTIFLCFISLSSSSLVLILHIWFSFGGPNILLKIFLSKINSYWIMVSFSTHVSVAQVTTGLITVLYHFNFEYFNFSFMCSYWYICFACSALPNFIFFCNMHCDTIM